MLDLDTTAASQPSVLQAFVDTIGGVARRYVAPAVIGAGMLAAFSSCAAHHGCKPPIGKSRYAGSHHTARQVWGTK